MSCSSGRPFSCAGDNRSAYRKFGLMESRTALASAHENRGEALVYNQPRRK